MKLTSKIVMQITLAISLVATPSTFAAARSLDIQPDITSGANHTCVLSSFGNVTCWGDNTHNQIDVPSDLGPALQVSAGFFHTCALTISHSVRCWGKRDLWDPSSVPGDLGPVSQVSTGLYHTCVITSQATVRCWGRNDQGQTSVPSDLTSVKQLSTNLEHTCALTFDGHVRCWGMTGHGPITESPNVSSVVSISSGASYDCAILSDGTVKCWGTSFNGETSVPTDLGGVIQISAGMGQAACAITTSNVLRCWGSNYYRLLDWNNQQVSTGSKVTTGGSHVCLLENSGYVNCWGYNAQKQIQVPSDLQVYPKELQSTSSLTINGDASVGSVISADSGPWADGWALEYQWFRDGVEIAGQKSQTYMLSPIDFEHLITVNVVASSWGYKDQILESNAIRVLSGQIATAPKPTLSVTSYPAMPSVVVRTGDWNSNLSIAWYRDGVDTGKTGPIYPIEISDIGSNVMARVTYSRFGYSDYIATSEPITVSILIPNTPCAANIDDSSWLSSPATKPQVSGLASYGSILSATPGSWTRGTRFCSYWYKNGAAIAGAISSTYRIQSSDINQLIQYVVIGTDKSGKSVLRYSQPIRVTKAPFSSAKPPKITGIGKVGVTLAGSLSNWTSGISYTYQWLRNGIPISAAQSKTYVATAEDLGATLSLQACGSKDYFETLCLTSPPTATVIQGIINPAPLAKIQGSSAKPGAVLTGVAGNWPSGVKLAIQWFRDGMAIQGETNSTYTIAQLDRGHSITFQVTGTAIGYTDSVKISTAKKIP